MKKSKTLHKLTLALLSVCLLWSQYPPVRWATGNPAPSPASQTFEIEDFRWSSTPGSGFQNSNWLNPSPSKGGSVYVKFKSPITSTERDVHIQEVHLVNDMASPFVVNRDGSWDNRYSTVLPNFKSTTPGWEHQFSGLPVRPDFKGGVTTFTFKVIYMANNQNAYKEDDVSITTYIPPLQEEEKNEKLVEPKIVVGSVPVPTLTAGQAGNLEVYLVNRGLTGAHIRNVTPAIGPDFPFEFSTSDMSVSPGTYLGAIPRNVEPSESNCTMLKVHFGQFKLRKDIKAGYVPILFHVDYSKDLDSPLQSVDVTTYINAVGTEGDERNQSTPRLLVAGFTTTPEVVKGGEHFTLHLQLRNTSTSTFVKNIRLTVDGGADKDGVPIMLLSSGASATYIANIPAGQTINTDINMEASAKADAKAHPITIALDFEDSQSKAIQAQEKISINIHQDARIDFGKIEISPEMAEVGQEVNVMFPIFNKGRSTLYNASIIVPEGQAISASENFIGNIEPGARKDTDMMIEAREEYMDPDPLKLQLRYEDENGHAQTKDISIHLNINPPAPPQVDLNMLQPEAEMEEGGTAWWVWFIPLVLLIVAIVVLVLLLRSRKKKKKVKEDLDDLDD